MNNPLHAAAEFLLECPPLEEINGSIVDVIERYRYKTITRPEALTLMLGDHYKYLTKFRDTQQMLSEELFDLDQQLAS